MTRSRLPPSPEELRQFPRIVIDREVFIVQRNDRVVRAKAHDISPDGLELLCDVPTARSLRPPLNLEQPEPECNDHVNLVIPLTGGCGEIRALCKVTYVKLMKDKQIAVGIHFTEIMGGSFARLERFIEESLEPA